MIAAALFMALLLPMVHADDRQAKGLPSSIATAYLEDGGFTRFEEPPESDPPLANGGIELTGASGLSPADVFEQQEWVRLPKDEKISAKRDEEGREIWTYPVGTEVAHRIFLRTTPRTLFEIRVGRLRADKRWAWGLYVASPGSKILQLQREGSPHLSFDVRVGNHTTHVEMDRLHPESCRGCHFVHSRAAYQYPSEEFAGPCGFVPTNPFIHP